MKTRLLGVILVGTLVATLCAEVAKPFPAHWGKPPQIQTQDHVELPGGYGHGSSTLKHWIAANLAKDKARGGEMASPSKAVLYSQDFQKLPAGPLPDEFMVLGGEFAVNVEGTNHFLELPGAPLDSFAVQFGPGEKENVAVSARVLGSSKGRRAPTFGVGLGGVAGFKLQVSPGKKTLELLKDQELKSAVPFDWKSGIWTQLRLRISKVREGEWKVEGKVWPEGEPEPKTWSLTLKETAEPISGRASVLGSPFAGTPIGFDDLVVTRVGK